MSEAVASVIAQSWSWTAKQIKKKCVVLIDNSIKRTLQIPLNELGKPNEKNGEEIMLLLSAHSPNNPNIFPI